jgi:hypothetical protein
LLLLSLAASGMLLLCLVTSEFLILSLATSWMLLLCLGTSEFVLLSLAASGLLLSYLRRLQLCCKQRNVRCRIVFGTFRNVTDIKECMLNTCLNLHAN